MKHIMNFFFNNFFGKCNHGFHPSPLVRNMVLVEKKGSFVSLNLNEMFKTKWMWSIMIYNCAEIVLSSNSDGRSMAPFVCVQAQMYSHTLLPPALSLSVDLSWNMLLNQEISKPSY